MNKDWNRFNGIGMVSARTRARMIARLREQGIQDEVVLAAMNAVPRHIFLEEGLMTRAYEDTALPIGRGQTISQPWVVARMTELARSGKNLHEVLEIGTGSGYQTAILAQVAGRVYTVERIGHLVARARRHLRDLGLTNVAISHADGCVGFAETLEVDAIVVTAGTSVLPENLLKHLRPGARMVIPLADDKTRHEGEPVQHLTVVTKTGDESNNFREQKFEAVRFVPLLPGVA